MREFFKEKARKRAADLGSVGDEGITPDVRREARVLHLVDEHTHALKGKNKTEEKTDRRISPHLATLKTAALRTSSTLQVRCVSVLLVKTTVIVESINKDTRGSGCFSLLSRTCCADLIQHGPILLRP